MYIFVVEEFVQYMLFLRAEENLNHNKDLLFFRYTGIEEEISTPARMNAYLIKNSS